ncbi:unnamed protein product [Mytilus coruscus]|uniref:QRICH1-like domain-containing protein n=1 Tax=Mytilus coruscus TaxID=42192 RepID=A0A6J8CQR4_MYTCO|nr:unnamed protein product [Mytilus coruscus]
MEEPTDCGMNVAEIDFLDVDMVDDVDDLTLSQVCQNVENEYFAFEGLQNLTLTQTLQNYQQDSSKDLETDSYGEFVVDSELGQNKRFGAPVSSEDLSLMIKQTENQNTKNNTTWAFNFFEKWRLSREGVVPELLNMISEDMDFWLQRFIVEARRKDGVEYPPKSLYLITCGLLRYLRDADVNDKKFLDEQNLNFCKFRKVLDARMKMLIEKGIGCEIKQAEPITQE